MDQWTGDADNGQSLQTAAGNFKGFLHFNDQPDEQSTQNKLSYGKVHDQNSM